MANRRADSDLHVILLEELEARGWDTTRFASELGLKYGVVSRWLDKNPRKRVVPQPWSCVAIAALFKLDAVVVFQHAGYLPMPNDNPPGPHRTSIEALKRRLDRTLDRAPDDDKWPLVLALTELLLDYLQAAINRIEGG